MLINHLTSGSDGNAIIVDDGETKLLLDAGVSYNKLAKWIRPSSLSGVLITHEHQDHSKAAAELMRRGANVYMSQGTYDNIYDLQIKPEILGFEIDENGDKKYHLKSIGSWLVLPLEVEHDCAEPLGFLFQSTVTEKKGIYIVDSAYVGYNFKEVTHWLIEANYSEELLEVSDDHPSLKKRIRNNHFSIDDLVKFLSDSDLSKTEEIYLLHLSNRNADEQLFRSKIEKQTGVPVYTISDSKTQQSTNKKLA